MSRKRKRRQRLPVEPVETRIDSLSPEGRGVSRIDDKVVFVDLALPGERLTFQYTGKTSKYAEGRAVEILEASPDRVAPPCEAFARCGGCSLQHMAHAAQLEHKQAVLFDQLRHVGQVEPQRRLPVVSGPQWGYRHKARLGVRHVRKKGRVLVGFRERGGRYLADMARCEVLHPSVGPHLAAIAEVIDSMEARADIAQIEVAVGDAQTVLVFRNLVTLCEADREKLTALARRLDVTVLLQPGKPDALEPLWPASPEPLYYRLDDFDLRIEFAPTDFTQVNPAINRQMVALALDKLEPRPDEQVLDLFCGLGNFSLALARRSERVTAVEGDLAMVQKARRNAEINAIDNAEFIYADLYSDDIRQAPWLKQRYDKILLDPPRSGALPVLPYLKKMQAKTIVYVSCHPATLARDAGVLVHELGYTLVEAGIMDMFPHTAHVESIAVFSKKSRQSAVGSRQLKT